MNDMCGHVVHEITLIFYAVPIGVDEELVDICLASAVKPFLRAQCREWLGNFGFQRNVSARSVT